MSIFVRNVITLGLGNLIAQLISVAAVPLITRLYTPEEYGIFTVYLAVSMAIFPIASLQFDTAAILPRKEEDGFILIVSSMIAVCIFSLLFCSALSAWNYYLWVSPRRPGSHLLVVFAYRNLYSWGQASHA